MSHTDRARAYIAKLHPAISGQHGHDRTFYAASVAVNGFGLSEADAFAVLLESFNPRCVPPWAEPDLARKIRQAILAGPPGGKSRGWLAGNATSQGNRTGLAALSSGLTPLKDIRPDLRRLAAIAARGPRPKSWRHWLWERSPVRPDCMNAFSFLLRLYKPHECLAIVLADDQGKQTVDYGQFEISPFGEPTHCQTDRFLNHQQYFGAWFLPQPICGSHLSVQRQGERPRWSWRSEENVVEFRYLVLESDSVPIDTWLGVLSQLPLPIASITTTGGRGAHALIEVEARTANEWRALIDVLRRPLTALGCDPGAITPIRLSRLPQCWRGQSGRRQGLWFLNPDPPETPLAELRIHETRAAFLGRMKALMPRWNPALEADQ